MSLTKYEIVKMARDAGFGVTHQEGQVRLTGYDDGLERFATLCRAPLIAENEGLKESLESVLSQLKERDAELARVRAGEPFGWYSAKEDDFMLDKIRKTHERLNSHTHRIGKYDLALYTTPPQPAAQEPTSAVPMVEQLVEAGEADELLRNLGLDPNAYRNEGGHINHLKVKAAIKYPEDYMPQCQHEFAMSASYGGKLCKHCGKPKPITKTESSGVVAPPDIS